MEATLVTDHRFKPGNKGRPKGIPNKLTTEKKQRLEWIVEELEETLEKDITTMKPKDRVELWLSLQEYIRPKLQRMNVDISPVEDRITKITFEVVEAAINLNNLPIGEDSQGIRSIPEKL
jgi:hypothetical protein